MELPRLIIFALEVLKGRRKKGKKLEKKPNFIFKESNAGRLQFIFPSNTVFNEREKQTKHIST